MELLLFELHHSPKGNFLMLSMSGYGTFEKYLKTYHRLTQALRVKCGRRNSSKVDRKSQIIVTEDLSSDR